MSDQDDTKVYARIIDGKIAEYPVFLLHIRNRAHPLDWYSEVHFDAQPELPPFYQYSESLSVTPDLSTGKYIVRASYSVIPVPLADLLASLIVYPEGEAGGPGQGGGTPMPITDIDPAKVQRIAWLATFQAQERMDQFAHTRGYDNMHTAIGYFNSTVPKFKAEAEYCNNLRDQVWQAFYAYMGKVMTMQVPVPTSLADIDAQLPPMEWPADIPEGYGA